jgi:hypothetical protein
VIETCIDERNQKVSVKEAEREGRQSRWSRQREKEKEKMNIVSRERHLETVTWNRAEQ